MHIAKMPLSTVQSSLATLQAVSIDANQLQKLTNLNDINKLLNETIAKERLVDADLDRLLSRRLDVEKGILLLNSSTQEMLELVRADSEQLLSSVKSTAHMAEKISSKVRRLDLAQTRVQDTLDRVRLIIDRSACIMGVQAAMESQDFETAAGYIATFLDLEAKLEASGTSALQLGDGPQLEEQRQVLRDAKERLEEMVDRRFEEAVSRRDAATVLRFAKLYKPLGKKGEGLRRLTEYLRLLVAGQAQSDYSVMSELLESGRQVDFVAALTQLFRHLAGAVEQHVALIRDTFGAEAVVDVIGGLQAECDSQGTLLLQRFMEARNVQRLVREVQGRMRAAATAGTTTGSGSTATTMEPGTDPRQVESVVEEVVQVCQRAEEYAQFMLSRMREALAPQPLSAVRETSFRSGQFSVTVRELMGYYTALEEFYMEASTSMAVRIDETGPDALTSSMVDDVMYILRASATRALRTGHSQSICALLTELNNILANSLRAALMAKLQGGASRLLAAAPLPPGEGPSTGASVSSGGTEHAIGVNNADVSAEYINKLRSEIEAYVQDAFTNPADRERVRSVLSDLAKTATDFRQVANRSLEQLSDALMPKLRPVFEELAAVGYQMNESEYAAMEVEGGWVHQLLSSVEQHVAWLRSLLTVNSYEVLFHLVLDKVVARVEAVLLKKTFNQLGGLQLDRDIRALVSALSLSEMTSRTVRDKFARLNQLAIVLGLEAVDEVLDYWSDDAGAITWRLSPEEVRAVLSLRVDFAQESINALVL